MESRSLATAALLGALLSAAFAAYLLERGRAPADRQVLVAAGEPAPEQSAELVPELEPLPPVAEAGGVPRDRAVAGAAEATSVAYLTDLSPVALLAIRGCDLDPSVTPTAEGLFAQTADLWASPDFLELSLVEARELITGGAQVPELAGPGRMLDALGGLPTEEDCRRALEDAQVWRLLAQVDLLDLVLVDLDFLPTSRRSPETARAIRALHEQRDRAALLLMSELERATSYEHWAIVHRVFGAWSQ